MGRRIEDGGEVHERLINGRRLAEALVAAISARTSDTATFAGDGWAVTVARTGAPAAQPADWKHRENDDGYSLAQALVAYATTMEAAVTQVPLPGWMVSIERADLDGGSNEDDQIFMAGLETLLGGRLSKAEQDFARSLHMSGATAADAALEIQSRRRGLQ